MTALFAKENDGNEAFAIIANAEDLGRKVPG